MITTTVSSLSVSPTSAWQSGDSSLHASPPLASLDSGGHFKHTAWHKSSQKALGMLRSFNPNWHPRQAGWHFSNPSLHAWGILKGMNSRCHTWHSRWQLGEPGLHAWGMHRSISPGQQHQACNFMALWPVMQTSGMLRGLSLEEPGAWIWEITPAS